VLGGRFVTGGLGTDAANFGQGTFETAEDLADGDLRRRASELVTTLVAALARDDPDTSKLVQDGAEEADRQALGIRELLSGQWFTVAGSKRTESPEGVFDPGGDVHTSIQPEFRARARANVPNRAL
jgi:hypothetical protein